ncbi:flagellar protein FlgN [Vallitalea guaymasensis]|uniref:Flagellar protein FlgN n=1 Tax=Vallitalea guaymasensis TaxID=1185412 RepID=A0A8J8SBP3_9FIRM|nr:flagellar protein FlgN [Vallitalea guaymasensis]QUH28988.1 flagellar protein FlgN [Vallitalea guaymasensis]
MASLIEDLITTLEEEKQCYNRLLTIGETKTEFIIKGDISSLNELTKEEQQMASRVLRIDKKREEIINDIAIVTNKNPDELTINNLAVLLAKQEKEHTQLSSLKEDIKDVVENLQIINDRNKILLKESLDYIDFTMNAIQSESSMTNSNYEAQGNIYNSQDGRRFFDAKQ